jgi:hypothetical protein
MGAARFQNVTVQLLVPAVAAGVEFYSRLAEKPRDCEPN